MRSLREPLLPLTETVAGFPALAREGRTGAIALFWALRLPCLGRALRARKPRRNPTDEQEPPRRSESNRGNPSKAWKRSFPPTPSKRTPNHKTLSSHREAPTAPWPSASRRPALPETGESRGIGEERRREERGRGGGARLRRRRRGRSCAGFGAKAGGAEGAGQRARGRRRARG